MTEQILDSHAQLMDRTYRFQRRIYDLTRAYYLLGRDRLIADLAPRSGDRVLEIACGTGRNLDKIARRYPDRRLYGLDISDEMLASARAKLGARAFLARADACRFSGRDIFRTGQFDRIVLSYSLSMIPDWQAALGNAIAHLAPGGALHVVDFHDQAGLPGGFRWLLTNWLARFHVTPRTGLHAAATQAANAAGCHLSFQPLFRGYAQYLVIRAPEVRRAT